MLKPFPHIDHARQAIPLIVGALVAAGFVGLGFTSWLGRYLQARAPDREASALPEERPNSDPYRA